ncbi:MAG: hypothetical protein LBD42_02455 [Desulfovibrio sp.]|jgi:hypothetical protein|nr:hypothetical protein [Desulfovibrio sp.]
MSRMFASRVAYSILCAFSLLLPASVSRAYDSPEIITVSGKVEIFAAGAVKDANPGFRLEPGQMLRLQKDGEVRLSAEKGNVELVAADATIMTYDGHVSERSLPWQGNRTQRVAVRGEPAQFSISMGQLDVQIAKGYPLRVVTPLIAASARGTRFFMTVGGDGSSCLRTLQGHVEVLGRSGEMRMANAGEGMAVTSSSYARFLWTRGVAIPAGGSWRDVDPSILDRVDAQTFSERFDVPVGRQDFAARAGRTKYAEGGISLDAVLANPGSHPLAGRVAATGASHVPLFPFGRDAESKERALQDSGLPSFRISRLAWSELLRHRLQPHR